MAAHTPGPWKAWDAPAGEFDPLPTWTVSDADGNDVCTLEDTNVEGNARLIAAAPTLLALLVEVVRAWDGNSASSVTAAIDAARTAVGEEVPRA